MPHSAIAIEYPRFSGINLERDFCAVGHSASKGEKPTGHVGPMGKAHAFAREEAKVWPWIGGEHSSGLGWLLAGLLADANSCCVNAVCDPWREFIGPLSDRLWRDSDSFRSRSNRPTQ
jgi:hypothetical protein